MRPSTLIVALLSWSALPQLAPAQEAYDVVISNGRVLDGGGNPWYRADLGVRGARIAAIGDLSAAPARRVIDAANLYVSPGFIDEHSHAGPGLESVELSDAVPLLFQGLTTVFLNPDGGGPVDLAAQRQRLLEHGLGVNAGLLVPHGSIRRAVIGMVARSPTAGERERMRDLVRRGMEDGGFGLSSGLFYAPGSYADTDELVELARVVSEFGGLYTSHIRDESDYGIGLVAAVEEVVSIARQAGIPGIVTHIKALGPPVWGFAEAVVMRIERARAGGVELYASQYPYAASSTGLDAALIPRWAHEGGDDSLRSRIIAAAPRARIVEAMKTNLARRGGAARIQISRYEPDASVEGVTLEAVATRRGLDPVEAALDLVRQGEVSIVSHNMDESDVKRFMRQPWVMTCSDGGLVALGQGQPHPRGYGAFPRRIQRYALEEGIGSLPDAIRSMTGLPATALRLEDRGTIRVGAVADIAVFDLNALRSPATYEDPHRLAQGMVYVLVNGQLAVDGGSFTGVKAGRILSRSSR